MWVTPWCLLWLWGNSPWPCTQAALVSRADSGIMGARSQGRRQDRPRGAVRAGLEEGWVLSFPLHHPLSSRSRKASGQRGRTWDSDGAGFEAFVAARSRAPASSSTEREPRLLAHRAALKVPAEKREKHLALCLAWGSTPQILFPCFPLPLDKPFKLSVACALKWAENNPTLLGLIKLNTHLLMTQHLCLQVCTRER